MKRVLFSLLACIAVVVGAWGVLSLFGRGTGLTAEAERFLRIYTQSADLMAVETIAAPELLAGEEGDSQHRKHRVIRRHMGKFQSIEKVLIERVRELGDARLGELQLLCRYTKGSALTKVYLVDFLDGWRVSDIEVEIPPELMRRSVEEFAQMIALEGVRRACRGEWGAVRGMATEGFQVKFSEDLLSDAVGPLLRERRALKNLGLPVNAPAGTNRRDVRVIAFFEEGLPLGFDLFLRWEGNRWRIDELAVEEAPGASVPDGQLHPAERGG